MAVEKNGTIGNELFGLTEERPDIFAVLAPRVDVSAGTGRPAMPAVIEAAERETAFNEVIDEICVAARVFTDSVNERHDGA